MFIGRSQAVVELWPYIHKLTTEERTDKHDVYRTITFNSLCNVLKVNTNGKNSIRYQTYAKTEDHIELELYFNSRHPRHWFSAQLKMQHLRISWRNPCIWRLDFCQIIKSCSCFLMDHKSKQVYSLIDRFMASEGSYTLILPFTSKTGQFVVQNRRKIF